MSPADLVVPDLALLLTPIAVPEQLAAICALAGVAADVFDAGAGAGCAAVLAELAGGAPEQAAAAVTKPLPSLTVYLLQRVAGQMTSALYAEGRQVPDADPVLYALLPDPIEGLILGTTTVAEIPGALRSAGVGKRAAAKWLALAAKRAPKAMGA